ncbi:MAG: pre-peptidase C-terminal domain-containing protein [Propionibacteriaceae bacterium]
MATALVLSAPVSSAQPRSGDLTAAQQQSLAAGLQIAPKGMTPGAKAARVQPNPYLANVSDLRTVDFSGWRQQLAAKSQQRASSKQTGRAKVKANQAPLPAPLVHREVEPQGRVGSNDSRAKAEPLGKFGTGKSKNPRAEVIGSLSQQLSPVALAPGVEDNGQIGRATDSTINGVKAVHTNGIIGDGPHGSAGDATNDFDFYRVRATPGLTITADTSRSDVDTVLALYDAGSELLATDDDSGDGFGSSRLTFRVPVSGSYYVLVAGFSTLGSLPANPRNSGSGAGGGSEGTYALSLSASQVDTDYYGLDLVPGDVLGVSLGGSATELTMYRPDGTRMVSASNMDATALYPPQSPLPGGGNTTLAYVAEKAGRYTFEVDGPMGGYDATVEVYRPGSETDPSTRVQTVFLDFDGARTNTAIWGGPGVRTLSPFSTFISRWGIKPDRETVLIRKITEKVRENIQYDLIAMGLNRRLSVRVINSRDNPDEFGDPNVSRVIVGGTADQLGFDTIGISQFVDPGNFNHEDSALVLLDGLSSPPEETGASLNNYLRSSSDRIGFVSLALSNVISHEIGHLIGNYHTDNADDRVSLMDAGGLNFANLYGVGPDAIGGTSDDRDVDFVSDAYQPTEGFAGKENTLNVAAWAFVKPGQTPSTR